MTAAEMMTDERFRSAWASVWPKLEPFMIEKMITFASANKGQHEKVGQFAEFMSEVMDDFRKFDSEFKETSTKRPKLHNTALR